MDKALASWPGTVGSHLGCVAVEMCRAQNSEVDGSEHSSVFGEVCLDWSPFSSTIIYLQLPKHLFP